jgi:hypothetical protein
MTTDAETLAAVRAAFADCPRPEHFTNYRHCCECAEHDDLLRSRDLDSLALEDVGNAGWDPICFITPEGFRYYLPALVRLALTTPAEENGPWYGDQLLFHLTSCGKHNQHLPHCTPEQRAAVVRFLWHILDTRHALAADYTLERELEQAIELWSG